MNSAGIFQAGNSWLHRLDPRVKLVITLASMALVLVFQNLWFLIGLFCLQLILFTASKLSLVQLRVTLITLMPVSVLMMLLRWVFYPQGTLMASIGPLDLTVGALAAGTVIALRILTLALAVMVWLGTTSYQDVIRSLVSLGFPYSWGLSFSLALRFLPEFFQTYQSIEQAQHARGLDFSGASIIEHIQGRQPIFIAMIISTFRKSEQMAIALEARAYGSTSHDRTDFRPLSMTGVDWLALLITLLGLAGFLAIHLVLGFGRNPL